MMTRARPMAMRRSRVQTRISLRKECTGDDAGAGIPGVSVIEIFFSSVLCIFSLPSIYNTGIEGGARLELRCESTPLGISRVVRTLPLDSEQAKGRCL